MNRTRNRIIAFTLALALVVGLLPGTRLTAYAANSTYTITFEGDYGVVTLSSNATLPYTTFILSESPTIDLQRFGGSLFVRPSRIFA